MKTILITLSQIFWLCGTCMAFSEISPPVNPVSEREYDKHIPELFRPYRRINELLAGMVYQQPDSGFYQRYSFGYMKELAKDGKTEIFEAELPEFLNHVYDGDPDDLDKAEVQLVIGYYEYQCRRDYLKAMAYLSVALDALKSIDANRQMEELYPFLIDCHLKLENARKAKQLLNEYKELIGRSFLILKESSTPLLSVETGRVNRGKVLAGALFFVLVAAMGIWQMNIQRKEKALNRKLPKAKADQPDKVEAFATKTVPGPEDYPDSRDMRDLKFQRLFANIKTYMEQEKAYLNPRLKVEDLAMALGTNTKYICRALDTVGNTRFNEMVNGYRIETAKKLLEAGQSETLIKRVAVKSGFLNSSSFHRKFKETTGMTPTDYVRKVSAKNQKY